MESISKGCLLILLTLTLPIHVAKASSSQSDNELPFSLTETVSIDELESARARNNTNNVDIRAILKGNAANNNTTGTNYIDAGSFAGSAGMFSVIQNTGNNVIIQDSTVVTVTIIN